MKALFSFCFLLFGSSLFGQILEPVSWNVESKHLSGNEFELRMQATIDEGWYVYSQYLESEDGPIATNINFDEGTHFAKAGKATEESKYKKEGFDAIFDMNVTKYSKNVTFVQKITVKDYSKPITGYLQFMTCDNERCLPPTDVDFDFSLKKPAEKTAPKTPEKKNDSPKKIAAPAVQKKTTPTPKNTPTTKATSTQKATETAETTVQEAVRLGGAKTAAPDVSGTIMRPVQWSVDVEQQGDEALLTFTANLADTWQIYSQFTDEGGPVPTAFYFTDGSHFERIGTVKEEGKKKEGPDPLFDGVNVSKFVEGPVTFTQRVAIKDAGKPIEGVLEFMTCDDEQCLPPTDVPFSVRISPFSATIGDQPAPTDAVAPVQNANDAADLATYGLARPDLDNPVSSCGETHSEEEGKGMWNIFFLGFIGGLVALLTPCVFPMIPLTVSFFTKGSENRSKGLSQAFMYGFFIFAVYLLLSVPFHLLDSVNPDILNDISTNVWLNLAFFAIFIFFAFSFFGYYELTLPASWSNNVSKAEGLGGILGVFFMALTLALVSFSCTGPILGTLLAGALTSTGGAWQLTAGMGGFGLALALPFALFAAFPSMMNSLPRSGGWLTSVKVVLGFLELGLAFKFLSNADLVRRWGLLKIEPLLIIWIIIAIGLALYLFGKIRFPHDSKVKKLGFWRISLGVISLLFAGYLATGFQYDQDTKSLKPLTLLSGFAPPSCYSWFYPCDCPQNLNCYKDLEKGMAHAKETNKPIMIDFTGHACVNCRKMEEHVWPKAPVIKQLDDFVLISLYVDDKRELPEIVEVEQANGSKRKLRNIGNKWSHFQTTHFQTNTQPYYVLMAPDGTLLNNPVGYTPDEQEYAEFLSCGLDAYEEWKKQ